MLDRIHKIAEIIAAFAIVGSLVFVGIQMQQNTEALKISATQASMSNWQEATLSVASNEVLVDAITIAGRKDSATWSPQERYRLVSYATSSMKGLELNYLRWLEGNLSDDLWTATRYGFINFIGNHPYTETVWRNDVSGNFTPQFQSLIEALIAESRTLNHSRSGAE